MMEPGSLPLDMDCDWSLLSNLVDSSQEHLDNVTLCETFFASSLKDVSSTTTNAMPNISDITTTTDTSVHFVSELSAFFRNFTEVESTTSALLDSTTSTSGTTLTTMDSTIAAAVPNISDITTTTDTSVHFVPELSAFFRNFTEAESTTSALSASTTSTSGTTMTTMDSTTAAAMPNISDITTTTDTSVHFVAELSAFFRNFTEAESTTSALLASTTSTSGTTMTTMESTTAADIQWERGFLPETFAETTETFFYDEKLSEVFDLSDEFSSELNLPSTPVSQIFTDLSTKIEGIYKSTLQVTEVPTTATGKGLQDLMDVEEVVDGLTTYDGTWFTTTAEFNEDLYLNDSVLKKPDWKEVNESLCKWYLPTLDQTPEALGKTGIALWVLGAIITVTLIVMFVKQAIFIYNNAHKSFRRHLYSITSIYVVMALLTSIGSGIPRAHAVCSGVKDVYMSIGIGRFIDLTIAMYGGENVMYWYVKDKIINLRVIPVCKCCFCIPRCKIKRSSVTILKWLVWQMKWSQAAYYLLKLIWVKSLENSLGIVPKGESSFWYMHILNVASFLSGVFALIIIGSMVVDDLQEKYNYTIKTKLVRFTILTTKLQRLLFEILEASNVFPCLPPYISKKFYKNVLKDFIYLLEVFLLGSVTFFVYNKRGEFEQGNSSEVPQPMLDKVDDPHEENGFPRDEEFRQPLNSIEPGDSNC